MALLFPPEPLPFIQSKPPPPPPAPKLAPPKPPALGISYAFLGKFPNTEPPLKPPPPNLGAAEFRFGWNPALGNPGVAPKAPKPLLGLVPVLGFWSPKLLYLGALRPEEPRLVLLKLVLLLVEPVEKVLRFETPMASFSNTQT